MDRNILNASSDRALGDKTPVAAKALIENMSLNSQQFTTINNSMVQTKVSKPQTTKLCGICTSIEHPTETCPILQDDSVTQLPQACAANFFNQSNNQRGYNIPDLSTNKYHPNWRNHPNLRYGNQQPTQQQLVIPLPQPQTTPQVSTFVPSGPSLEDLVKQMAVNDLQFQQQTNSSIQTLQTQIGQLATSMNAMRQAQGSNQLPAQTIVNPKGLNVNVSAILLRSRKVTEPALEKNKKILEVTPEPSSVVIEIEPSVVVETEKEKEKEYVPPVPFPHRILKNKRTGDGDKEREILDVFIKVAVNIPLLGVIKQVPKYAKFLKDLCTSKKRLKGNERENLGRNISALIQPKHSPEKATVSSLNQAIPQKCKDPGTFVIPCTIGDNKFNNCILDLGAGINVMPTSIYNNLDLGPLQHIGLIIQLANRSNARPIGVVEDVFVQVNDLIFPAYFYILDMYEETNSSRPPIILGRPFMKMAKTKIVVDDGTITKVHLSVDRIESDMIMVVTESEVQLEDNRLAEEDYRMEKPKAKGDSKDEDE
ncbi:uncharacterized protein LOC127104362 [Lathyrus oleraceus]|uniref:uncharacterized protein LOC127104362 n=1 Tax=Pisum sativum TaxID=3888 RepID=UPI0021D20F1B|nr:uncharacterized protein LOC127104362 [Pisum sativum]